MKLEIQSGNRWCVAERRSSFSLGKIRGEIMRGENINSGFTVAGAEVSARDQTQFKAYSDGRELLIAVAALDTVGPTTRFHCERLPNRQTVEIFLAPWNDELGWFQFCFQPDGRVDTFSHVPYPEAHSTTMPWLRLRRFKWEADSKDLSRRIYWLFAWFPIEGVFRAGKVCGFNVARYNPPVEEVTSWNHTSAVGCQDATSFGRLHLDRAPSSLQDIHAELDGNRLSIEARIVGGGRKIGMNLVNPKGESLAMTSRISGSRFHASARIPRRIPGRYRLCPVGGGGVMEPGDFNFDLVTPGWADQFRFSLTYDIPDNVGTTTHYTPARLGRELGCWKEWGIERIYWIEYGPVSHWRSLWDQLIGDLARKTGGDNVGLTRKYCDDLVGQAARSSKRLGMEFFGVFKPFDMGINTVVVKNDHRSCVRDIEERWVCVMPEIAEHPEWRMRRNPAWHRREVFPITRLVIRSETPVPAFAPSKLKLWCSRDNLHYTEHRKAFRLKQRVVKRPHERWTPAGKVLEETVARNWQIEISGLSLDSPFVAVEIEGQDFEVNHRAFALVEAWSGEHEAPVTLSTGGGRATGFMFGKMWDWANHTAPIVAMRTWKTGPLAMVFREEEGPSALLDPGFEGTRKIWLARIKAILDSGADGVDIRTLGHHNAHMGFLQWAFAEPVRDAFRRRYGRPVQPTPSDYTRVRKLRGEMYTGFLREAKALVARHGKKLSAHLEWGVEVPAHFDDRMAMELDWRTWIGEGIVDEMTMRGWGSQNRYVQREILPLARRKNVPVHYISRCIPGGLDLRAVEVCERFVREACSAGLSGFSLYEACDLLRMNREGVPMPVGNVDAALRSARSVIDHLRSPRSLA